MEHTPHHHHHHDHHHHAPAEGFGRAFAIGISLNLLFVLVEVVFGLLAGSMALLADAAHNLSDVLGLALAWGAAGLARLKPTPKRTYGFRRATILASLLSALMLMFALGGIAWESIHRLYEPQPVVGQTMILVALIGTVINGATAWLFHKGQHDLNLKAAYLHMVADAAISLGVAVAGGLMLLTGWLWLDPALSLAVVLVILLGSYGLLRDSLNLTLDSVPPGIAYEQVADFLCAQKEVAAIHDLHIWALGTTDIALTVHLELNDIPVHDHFLHELAEALHDQFGIGHSTIQLETAHHAGHCPQAVPGAL